MRLTIIIKIKSIELFRISLKNLVNQSIRDKLEIICINENFDDTIQLIEEYSDKCKISYIDKDVRNTLYSSLLEATGEYLLITDSNKLSSIYYSDTNLFKRLYETASENDSEILIYNINKKQANNKKYNFIESMKDNFIDNKSLTKDQIMSLCDLDCDILFSNKFKLFHLEYKNVNQTDILKLKSLLNSHKIYILNDFSQTKTYPKKIIPENLYLEDSTNEYKEVIENIDNQHTTTLLSLKEYKTLISIIIPVRNPFIKDVLKSFYSILNQTIDFQNLEILFINDCSTYLEGINTLKEIIKKYPNVHLYNTQIKSGLAKAYNMGLDNAQGKYIIFQDINGYFLEDACKLLYNTITKYDVDMVSGSLSRPNDNVCSGWKIKNINHQINFYEDTDKESELYPLNLSIYTKIFSKDFLNKENIKFQENHLVEERIFLYNVLFSNSKFLFIEKPVYSYESKDESEYQTPFPCEYSFKNLLMMVKDFIYLNKLFEIHADKQVYITLNDMNYLTNYLICIPLSFREFKTFVDTSYEYYKTYLENKNTKGYPEYQNFIKSLIELRYIDAFNEYKRLSNKINIPEDDSKKIISIILNVYDKDLLEIGLRNLFNKFIFNLEIICIRYCSDDIISIIKDYRDKFYNIKVIDPQNDEYFFNRKIVEANGEYIILASLNNMIDTDYVEHLYNVLYENIQNNYNLTLLNLNRHKDIKSLQSLDKFSDEFLYPNNLTVDNLSLLYTFKCDKIISYRFIIKTTDSKIEKLSPEPLTYLDLLNNADKIYLPKILSDKNRKLEKVSLPNGRSINNKREIKSKIEYLRNHLPLKANENETINYNKTIIENKHPKISIIIPVYNPKNEHIQRLMISLLNQTFDFNELEIIFIDDQSSKREAIELIKQYSQEYPNIKLYQTLVNSGSGSARNIGLDNAHGKYIMFLDHDDYYLSNACKTLYDTIEKEEAMMVQGNFINPDSDYYPLDWNNIGASNYKTVTRTIGEKRKFFRITCVIWYFILRKDYLDKYNIRFKNYSVSQDTLFNYACKLNDVKTIFINEPIVFHQKRNMEKDGEKSISFQRSFEHLLTRFKVFIEISNLLKNYDPKYEFIILNSAKFLKRVWLRTDLNYPEFKKVVDHASIFYNDFLNDKKVNPIDKESRKFFRYVAKKDYINAYREYTKQRIN